MLRRVGGYLLTRNEAPPSSVELQAQGHTLLPGVLNPTEVQTLSDEIEQVYRDYPADGRAAAVRDPDEDEDFRYEMFNRSPLSQKAIAHAVILDTIEPLLGEDCHVIANTCWKNPPRESNTHGGGFWHIDAGLIFPARQTYLGTSASPIRFSPSVRTSISKTVAWRTVRLASSQVATSLGSHHHAIAIRMSI